MITKTSKMYNKEWCTTVITNTTTSFNSHVVMKEKNIKKSRTYYNKIIIHKDELRDSKKVTITTLTQPME